MIEFNTVSGGKVAINPMLVFAVEAAEGGTMIISAAGGVAVVRDDFDAVQRRISAWAKSA